MMCIEEWEIGFWLRQSRCTKCELSLLYAEAGVQASDYESMRLKICVKHRPYEKLFKLPILLGWDVELGIVTN
jgi:hypothetical protein